jgi:dihydrofolate synthase/folylpolyglutamate synthase
MKQLISLNYDKIHIVFGVVNDKNIKSLINYLPKVAQYYLCEASVPRAMNINYLAEYFSKAKLNYSIFDNVKSALENAKLNASKNDVIYIGGSLFVVAEILP